MKKIISTLIIALVVMVSTVSMAAETSMSLSFDNEKTEAGKEVKLYVTINGLADEGNQNAIEFKLTYDSTKLEYKSTKGANDWAMQASTDGTGFVGSKSGTVGNSEKIAEITFKVKDNTEVGKINVSATDILVAVDTNPEKELASTSKNLEVIGSQQEPEDTTPEDTTPEETKPEETKPEESKPEETKPEETKPEETKKEETKTENKVSVNPTEKPKQLPKAGESDLLITLGIILVVVTIITYKKIKTNKEI